MEKEVKRMTMRFAITEGRRIDFRIEARLFAALINRVYRKVCIETRYTFTVAHDLFHSFRWLLTEIGHLFFEMPSITSLFGWFAPEANESKGSKRDRAVVFSERLRVRFLHLAGPHAQALECPAA